MIYFSFLVSAERTSYYIYFAFKYATGRVIEALILITDRQTERQVFNHKYWAISERLIELKEVVAVR
jgi:hypothetical protein